MKDAQLNATLIKRGQEEKTVYTTRDYKRFSGIDGNRTVNPMHLSRLKRAISLRYLFTIITVNEHMQIIDGQHRFEIIRELGLELNYVICPGYGLEEVHLFNEVNKTWNAEDYMHGYVSKGLSDYVKYQEFKKKYRLGHNETASLLRKSGGKQPFEVFYGGQFKIIDYDWAVETIELILSLENFYRGVRRREFIFTMINMLNHPNFIFDEFLQKLKQQPTALKDCPNRMAYRELIENIYNYKRRDKVNLRYAPSPNSTE